MTDLSDNEVLARWESEHEKKFRVTRVSISYEIAFIEAATEAKAIEYADYDTDHNGAVDRRWTWEHTRFCLEDYPTVAEEFRPLAAE